MHSLAVSTFALVALANLAFAQYHGYNNGNDDGNGYAHNSNAQGYLNKYQGPKINIISHKQALSHDGTFNFAFNADNGIQQGESISPDGSRQGAYSYVDPTGKTVSLKYVADREGFRVIHGDHIPKAVPLPATHAAAYQAAAKAQAETGPYQGQGQYQYAADESNNDGQYYEPSNQGYRSAAYSGEAAEPEHTGPHSFGNGFAFEFGGAGKY